MLRFKDFKVGYGEKNVVLKINREIASGFHLLIAPNGSGKSTWMKTLAGWIPRLSGEVWFKESDQEKGFEVEQTYLIPEHLSFPKLVYPSEWLDAVGADGLSESSEWVKEFGMSHKWKQYVGRFSQGERRKIHWLASTVVSKPLVLLDEAANGLDLKGFYAAQKLVAQWKSQNKIVVLSTHRFAEWLDVCDSILLIQNGELVSKAPADLVGNRSVKEVYQEILRIYA